MRHWIESTGALGDGYICEECRYFVKKGDALPARCPACRKLMNPQPLRLQLFETGDKFVTIPPRKKE